MKQQEIDTTTSTIAAIATAHGECGIGIVRISGPRSLAILKEVFRTAPGEELSMDDVRPRTMMYGFIVHPSRGHKLDEVLCVYMKAPHSYTAEDVVEIQCHGSAVSIRNILSACYEAGAEPAEAGEFTKRAFLNGRIDLAQAEAVIDLVRARSERSFDVALRQSEGSLSRRVEHIRDLMRELLILLVVNIDHPEEDIEFIEYEPMEHSLQLIDDALLKLLESSQEGKRIREGVSIAIVGKPNVGKSSLLNFFLRENRAIVTEIPGTTRDTIEEHMTLSGIPLRLIDTAGIRESEDEVERLGIERSKEAFNRADLLLFLIDASQPLSEEDRLLCDYVTERPCIVLLNKSDLPRIVDESEIRQWLPEALIVSTSLLEGEGLEELKQAIERWITGGKVHRKHDVFLANVRHIDLVRRARDEIVDALKMTRREEAVDFIEVNVRAAYDALGEITGETIADDLLDEIFSRFCLGK